MSLAHSPDKALSVKIMRLVPSRPPLSDQKERMKHNQNAGWHFFGQSLGWVPGSSPTPDAALCPGVCLPVCALVSLNPAVLSSLIPRIKAAWPG